MIVIFITKNFFKEDSLSVLQYICAKTSTIEKRYKRTNYVKQTLSQKGSDICNSLQSDIKDINSCTAFKKQFKQHLLLNPT